MSERGGVTRAVYRSEMGVIDTFRVQVPIRALFAAPTVADMAEVIVQRYVEEADLATIARMLTEVEQGDPSTGQLR